MCSDTGHRIYHHHVSTQNIRNVARKYQNGYIFHCTMFKASESRVRDLTRALTYPKRLESIVVAGINNIGDGQAVEDIVEEFMELME